MGKGGIPDAADEYCRINHFHCAIFRFIFWNWIYPEYAPENVMGNGNYLPISGNPNCR